MKTFNKLNREEMKNVTGGLVYVPPGSGGDGTHAYVCNLASGIGTIVYGFTVAEGQAQCSHFAGVNCSPPVVFAYFAEA